MTRTISLAALGCLFFLAQPQAEAQSRFRLDDATRAQIRTILTDLRAQTGPLRDQIRAQSQTFVDGIKAELQLNDFQTFAVRWRLRVADFVALRNFNALPAADQTAANLSAAMQAEYQKVFAGLTADATQLANLAALGQTYADGVAPLKLQIKALVDAARTQIRALIP